LGGLGGVVASVTMSLGDGQLRLTVAGGVGGMAGRAMEGV